MSITRVAGADRGAGFVAPIRLVLPDLLFVLLAVYNTIRLFRHVMWRDELQAFMVAAASNTPLDLFAKLKYEGHPGLWHLLLWVITRFTTDPVAMQVLQLVIALGVWVLVWRLSPFRPVGKLLLLLSYYLFWEYFVVSRGYALGVLLGFSFVALQAHRPQQRFWPWVLLGLLANTTVFGTIWSFALGLFYALRNRQEWRLMLPGATLYAALAALAIVTMLPASDFTFGGRASAEFSQFDMPLHFAIGAFVPFFSPFVGDVLHRFGGAAADLAASPFVTDPVSQLFPILGGGSGNLLFQAAVLALPILACFIIVRDALRTAEFALTYFGVLLFVQLWQFPGAPHHYGILFVAFVGAVWMWRSTLPPRRAAPSLWVALLVINAVGGLMTLAWEFRPFSQSRNAATWIETVHLEDKFLMGSPDWAASSVAGYLQRPLYYLDCECFGTHVVWNEQRADLLGRDGMVGRAIKAMTAEGKSEGYLIVNHDYRLGRQTTAPDFAFEPVKRFPEAFVSDERYIIYRVRHREN